jgi:hypothetical protein
MKLTHGIQAQQSEKYRIHQQSNLKKTTLHKQKREHPKHQRTEQKQQPPAALCDNLPRKEHIQSNTQSILILTKFYSRINLQHWLEPSNSVGKEGQRERNITNTDAFYSLHNFEKYFVG